MKATAEGVILAMLANTMMIQGYEARRLISRLFHNRWGFIGIFSYIF